MAKIEDLIDEIADPGLRERIASEVKELKRTKRSGLGFEEHISEPCPSTDCRSGRGW